MSKIKFSHITHLSVLGAISTLSVLAFVRFNGMELLQLYVVAVAVIAYIAWGVVYHFYHKSLSWGVFLEYVLVGSLVILLFFWTLFA
jgi:hypothetical protein